MFSSILQEEAGINLIDNQCVQQKTMKAQKLLLTYN
jgi:hypothetical protein